MSLYILIVIASIIMLLLDPRYGVVTIILAGIYCLYQIKAKRKSSKPIKSQVKKSSYRKKW